MRKFFAWLFKTHDPGVRMRDWLTPAELKDCTDCSEDQFQKYYDIAFHRKNETEAVDDMWRCLAWIIIAATIAAIVWRMSH
jgi:hypothetical protein